MKLKHFLAQKNINLFLSDYCVFRPANGCSARRSLVEIKFLTLKQLFAYFLVILLHVLHDLERLSFKFFVFFVPLVTEKVVLGSESLFLHQMIEM